MEDLLISTLEKLGYPVLRQGSLSEDEKYPETFITFWNDESSDGGYRDNSEQYTIWEYSICIYSSNPTNVYNGIFDIKTSLRGAGFIVNSCGHDVGSDEPTHIGRGIDVQYREEKEIRNE